MLKIKRSIEELIAQDLDKGKMVFIGGPRQVGKTTLALKIAENRAQDYDYLNWDNLTGRKNILAQKFDSEADFLLFDEIHKFKNWKNYVKGVYDVEKFAKKIIVTGSARLNVYHRGGDSLLGRYYYYTLHPFSLVEILELDIVEQIPGRPLIFPKKVVVNDGVFDKILNFGGFPSAFLTDNERELRRWHRQRNERLIKEDIRDLTNLKELDLLEILQSMLPERVGSPFSLNSLVSDLQVNHRTIANWLAALEHIYYCYRIYPFHKNVARAIKKEPKVYLWDWSELNDIGSKLENLVAAHLLKFVNFLQEAMGYKAELNYIRDREGNELDFVVVVDGKPWFAVEVKSKDTDIAKGVKYFMDRLDIPYFYQVTTMQNIDYTKNKVRVLSLDKFLLGLV